MDKIIMKVHGAVVKEIPISSAPNAEYFMGRDLQSQVVIEDQKASRRHVVLAKKNGRYFLKDLGSTNGSYLNETEMLPPKEDREIFHGDVMRIGDHQLVFDLPSLSGTVSDGGEIPAASPIDMGNATLPMMGGGGTMRIGSIDQADMPASKKGTVDREVQDAIDRMKAHLLVVLGDTREIYEINQPEISIGRDPSNDICIGHHSISSCHAKFQFGSGRFMVEDLRSTNGTMVNGILIHKQSAASPSLIVFGDVVCLFSTEEVSTSRESQDKMLKQVTKNLVSQGLVSKKQLKNSLREVQGSSFREVGESLILSGLINPDHLLGAMSDKGQRKAKKKPLWLIFGIPLLLILVGLGAGVFYLIQKRDQQTKDTYQSAKDLWKKSKKEKDSAIFEKAEKAFLAAIRLASNNNELKETIRVAYARMLMDYGTYLTESGKGEKALPKFRAIFPRISEKLPLYKEAALAICRHYEKKAMESSEEDIKIKFYKKIVEASEEEIGFDTRLMEKEKEYKDLCIALARIYFFRGIDFFKEGKIIEADKIWKEVTKIISPYKDDLYQFLANAGRIACEFMRKHQSEDAVGKETTKEQFMKVWEKMTAKYPKYLEILKKTRSLRSIQFKDKIDELSKK